MPAAINLHLPLKGTSIAALFATAAIYLQRHCNTDGTARRNSTRRYRSNGPLAAHFWALAAVLDRRNSPFFLQCHNIFVCETIQNFNYDLFLFYSKLTLYNLKHKTINFILLLFWPFSFLKFQFRTWMASHHYKKNGLLRRSKTAAKAQKSAAKGPFTLQRRVLLRRAIPSVLQCRYRQIAAVAKSAAIDVPFSGG